MFNTKRHYSARDTRATDEKSHISQYDLCW